ncbi:MAG: hypothetical protein J1F18_03540 [Lachnospiraceae bacterium]|nr:hypothetical protein [Lachnospiraceae bacterium]
MKMVILATFIATAYLYGIYEARYRQNQQENKSTIMTIAVVNADSGVMVEGEKVYYAAELMSFPDTNFESTGLTDAEEGVASGRYAAYILIPETFSTSVNSVNEEPVKTQITYALYDNLRQDVEVKVVNDIHNFILNLSTNISYIYVDAILREMHAVQDDSETIMQNDLADMEAIIGVQTEELIEEVIYDPLEIVETELTYLDLTDDYQLLEQTMTNIDNTYMTGMEAAENEFAIIKEGGTAVGDQRSLIADTFAMVDILTDAEDNLVYETGMTDLVNLAGEFEEDVSVKKFTAKERLGFQEGDQEPEPEPELQEGEVRIYISKDDLISMVNNQINFLELTRDKFPKGGANVITDTGELVIEGKEENYQITQGDVKNAITALNNLKDKIEEYYTNGIRAINEIPDVSEFASMAEKIISEEIKEPIMDEVSAESENVMTVLDAMQSELDAYVEALDEYDAMSYLDLETIMRYQDSMYSIITDMEDEIIEQDDAYIAYIDDVVQTTDINIETLWNNLDSSYEHTQENIILTMDNFKENRTNINTLNITLLDDLTRKLPYTRLGTLEYTQVYDFIVQPVVSDDKSLHSVISVSSVNMDLVDLINMAIGITALLVIYISVQVIHKKYLRAKEEGKEDEPWQMEFL